MRLVDYEILINAPPRIVYDTLTDPAALLTWIAVDAESEPIPGGRIWWTLPDGSTMLGSYVELRPPRRLVFRYGWAGDLMGVPPESTLVEIDLHKRPNGTLLRLTHRLLPDAAADQHRAGWDYFLRRLAATFVEPTSSDAPRSS